MAYLRAESPGKAKDKLAQAAGWTTARAGEAGRRLRAERKGGPVLVQVRRAFREHREDPPAELERKAGLLLSNAPPRKRQNPNKVRGGLKSLATREDRDHKTERDIDPDLVDIWEKVKWHMATPPGMSKAEAFTHYAHDNPSEISDLRTATGAKLERGIQKLQTHCTGLIDDARRSLASQSWDLAAAFEDTLQEQLSECAGELEDEGYGPEQLALYLRSEEEEAAAQEVPF